MGEYLCNGATIDTCLHVLAQYGPIEFYELRTMHGYVTWVHMSYRYTNKDANLIFSELIA